MMPLGACVNALFSSDIGHWDIGYDLIERQDVVRILPMFDKSFITCDTMRLARPEWPMRWQLGSPIARDRRCASPLLRSGERSGNMLPRTLAESGLDLKGRITMRTLIAVAVAAAFALNAQAQDKPAPAPAWKQGMSEKYKDSKLAPHPGKMTETPASEIPVDKIKAPQGSK
jgi:hypothetical protein